MLPPAYRCRPSVVDAAGITCVHNSSIKRDSGTLRECAKSASRNFSANAIFSPGIQLVVLPIFRNLCLCYAGGIKIPGNGMLDALEFLKHALRAPDELETRLVHCFRVNPC